MPGKGLVAVDFGAPPGSSSAEASVAAPTVDGATLAEAWVVPADTADHSADEHIIDPPAVCAVVVPGVGLRVIADASRNPGSVLHGAWSVGYVWA